MTCHALAMAVGGQFGVPIVAIHQVLEKIIILRSSLYSIRVHTYDVDGQLPSIKQITQATGDLQAI